VPLRHALLVLISTALVAVALAAVLDPGTGPTPARPEAAPAPMNWPAPAPAAEVAAPAPPPVPDVIGQPYGVAQELLRAAGYRGRVDDADATPDDVVAVAADEPSEDGTVLLVLSDNPLGRDEPAEPVAAARAKTRSAAREVDAALTPEERLPATSDTPPDLDVVEVPLAEKPAPAPEPQPEPVAPENDTRIAAGTLEGVQITCEDEYRLCVRNSDGEWVVWKAFDLSSHRAPGSIVSFAPADRADGSLLVNDAGEPGVVNDPRYGGLGAFGWQHARRVGCCDASFVDAEGDVSADHAWSIDARENAATAGFGVSRTFVHRPATFLDPSTLAFGLTVEFKDLYTDPILRVTYEYEFYDRAPGTADDVAHPGGVRVWMNIESLCPNGACGNTDMAAFLKEPKLVASLAPAGDGSLEYAHISVRDQAGNTVSQCNLEGLDEADGGDPARPDSCQVPRLALEAGAVEVRFDDGAEGCDPARHQCFSASFRAYPGGLAPHASSTFPWANPQYGPWAWAQQSWARDCFAPVGADAGQLTDGCAPAFADGTGGCLAGAESGPLAGPAGLVTRWELHRKGGAAQVLVPGWEGGFGAYDCPAALRRFGPGESWGLYANYTYGAGLDVA
jgi:hypothetical protein